MKTNSSLEPRLHPSIRFCLASVLVLMFSVMQLVAQSSTQAANRGPAGGLITGPSTLSTAPKVKAESLGSDNPEWYKDQVMYHLWIPAFYRQPNGPNDRASEGNIKGVLAKLDYLQDLGITAIWFSPFWNSGSTVGNRHNYDAINHYQVHPAFGTNEDLAQLLNEMHKRGMRAIIDYVPNHISVNHPWFLDAKDGKNGRKDWFLWSKTRPIGWKGFDNLSDWWGPLASGYYYGVFDVTMPDLNYRNPDVQLMMKDVMQYWLDFGFDGMRVDAVRYLIEDLNSDGTTGYSNQPESMEYFQKLRSEFLDAYAQRSDKNGKPLHKFMVAENWTDDRSVLAGYMYRDGKKGFNMTLDFPVASKIGRFDVKALTDHFNWADKEVIPNGGYMATFLSNHDNFASRVFTAMGSDLYKTKFVSALQMFIPGVPIIYYGNEIAMPGQSGTDVDLRKPFQWKSAETQRADPSSVLNMVRMATALRQSRQSLRTGTFTPIPIAGQDKVLAFIRTAANERTLVIANLSNRMVGDLSIDLSAFGGASSASVIFGTDSFELSSNSLILKAVTPWFLRAFALDEKVARLPGTPDDLVTPELAASLAPKIYTSPEGYKSELKAPALKGGWDNWKAGFPLKQTGDYQWQVDNILLGNRGTDAKINDGALWLGWGPGEDFGITYNAAGSDPNVTVESDKSQYLNIRISTKVPGKYRFLFDEKQRLLTIVRMPE